MIKHVAMVMDGNRRWATQRGMMQWLGHQEGAKTVEKAIDFCLAHGIKFLSLYAFSLENIKRSAMEKEFLFNLLVAESEKMVTPCLQKGISIKFIGDKNLYPADVLRATKALEEATKNCSVLQVNFLLFYGAQQEIIWSIKELIRKIQCGEIKESDITPELFEQCLWTHNIPEPELIIRTGGRNRLSNFLLYQSAYSELIFTDTLWPDMTTYDFEQCLVRFKQSQRNFGA